jgi:hypothetical protein
LLAFLSSTLSEEEYFELRTKQNKGTGRHTKSAVQNAKLFCTDAIGHELSYVVQEMSNEVKKTQQLDVALIFMQKFIYWMHEPHPHLAMPVNATKKRTPYVAKDIDTIRGYVGQLRLYLKKVGGIPLHTEDIKDYSLSYPPPIEKDEPEPMLLSEFKIICDHQRDFRRQMLYRAMKSFESRIGATVQLRRKHFNTDVRPIEVFFPAAIMKKKNGKSCSNTKYVITEDEEEVLQLLDGLKDTDLVYGTNENVELALNNEEKTWSRLMENIGFGDRYEHNNHLKKNIHSIKSMTFTAAEEAVNETFAHAYGDHSRYTKTYLRWSAEKKIKKFRLLEPYISMYTQVIHVNPKELQKRNSILEDKLENMQSQLTELATEKKDKTKIIPEDEKVQKVLKFMEEQNLL